MDPIALERRGMSAELSGYNPSQALSRLLGLYRAEWLDNQLYELFAEPTYFAELTTNRPCVLIGGRGTGKTTVLKGLTYKGQYELIDRDPSKLKNVPFIGLYYRVNTNRVTAFQGAEIAEDRWIAFFAHYLNLVFCQLVLDFVDWHQEETGEEIELPKASLRSISLSLAIDPAESLDELADSVEDALISFETAINTIADAEPSKLSLQAAPVDLLTTALLKLPSFKGKQFFFLVDEFENLCDYQQRVLNTIIKHSSAPYTFKVGVRELGWRQRATLAAHEQLTHPADYARIRLLDVLKGAKFKAFAQRVVETRFRKAYAHVDPDALRMERWLPELSEMDEAALLSEPSQIQGILDELDRGATYDEMEIARRLRPGELLFIHYWASAPHHEGLLESFRGWIADEHKWRARMVNHFHASLFAIRKGKVGVRKFYVGWETFLSLANGNIRYLIELVHTAFLRQLDDGVEPPTPVSPEIQTKAAQEVGSKNLAELEGVSVEGAKLTKLLLSLGRVFQLLASDPAGHAPETNQFRLGRGPRDSASEKRALNLIEHAVMHQAIVRFAGSKPTDDTDTMEYDYALHPIFAPLFVFSYRRKRKLTLDPKDILDLIERHRDAIRRVLKSTNRESSDSLPDQLTLFDAYYEER
ncbi:ORC-CDC6 family AAA ATPase [Acidovorax sp.]|uniref:ORC-CDC6 family AAA ATPase n=1 Tax=Acidovorax sp. TaxID=1872122 RepID=UPI0040381DCD